MIKMTKSLGVLALLGAMCSVGIALGGVDRFVSSANGDDLGGLNDCRDLARPCKTIRQALARAETGDVIKVMPGPPYEECGLEIEQQVKIVSESIRAVVGPDPEKRAIDEKEADDPLCPRSSRFIFQISGDKAKGSSIERLSLRGRFKGTELSGEIDPQEQPALLIVKDTSGVTIKENLLVVVKKEGDEKDVGVGLKLLNSSFKEITDNEVQGTRKPVSNAQGIVLLQVRPEPSMALEVKSNKVSGHGGAGILIENADLKPSLRLLGNTVEKNGVHGVSGNQVSGLTIEANQILNNMQNGIELFCKDSPCERIVLRDNTITRNGLGIHLEGTGEAVWYSDVAISGNTIQSNRGTGLNLAKGQYGRYVYDKEKKIGITTQFVKIENNHLEGNQTGVIVEELKGGSSLELVSNNISGHKEDGLTIKLADATGAMKLIVSGNTISQNAGSGLVLKGFNTTEGSEIKVERLISSSNNEGVVLQGTQNIALASSQLVGNRCAGLVLDDLKEKDASSQTERTLALSSGNTISNNTIASNGRNCPRDPKDPPLSFQINGGGIVLKGESHKNNFVHNVLDRNLNGISLRLSKGNQKEEDANKFQCNVISTSDHSGILVLPESSVTALFDSFNNNNIVGNPDFGLRNFTNIKINAQQNWWGDTSGPKHETNPDGKGDRILGPADFSNWLRQPIDINRCP